MGNGQSFTENEGDEAHISNRSSSSHHRSSGNKYPIFDGDGLNDAASLARKSQSLSIKKNYGDAEYCASSHDEPDISCGSVTNRSSSSPTTSDTRYSQTNSVVTFDDEVSSSIDDTSFSKSNSLLYDTDEVTALTDMAHDGDDELTEQLARKSRRSKWSSHFRKRSGVFVKHEIDRNDNEEATEEETIVILDAEEEFSRCSSSKSQLHHQEFSVLIVPATDVACTVKSSYENHSIEEKLTDSKKDKYNDCNDDVSVKLYVLGVQGVPVEPNPNLEPCAQSKHSFTAKQTLTKDLPKKALNSVICTEQALSVGVAKYLQPLDSAKEQHIRLEPVGLVLPTFNVEPNLNRSIAAHVSDVFHSLKTSSKREPSENTGGLDVDPKSLHNESFALHASETECSIYQKSENEPSKRAADLNTNAERNIHRSTGNLVSNTTAPSLRKHSEDALCLETDSEPNCNGIGAVRVSTKECAWNKSPRNGPFSKAGGLVTDAELNCSQSIVVPFSENLHQNSEDKSPDPAASLDIQGFLNKNATGTSSQTTDKSYAEICRDPHLNVNFRSPELELQDVQAVFRDSVPDLPILKASEKIKCSIDTPSTVFSQPAASKVAVMNNPSVQTGEPSLHHIFHVDESTAEVKVTSSVFQASATICENLMKQAVDDSNLPTSSLCDIVSRTNTVPLTPSLMAKKPSSPKPEDNRGRNSVLKNGRTYGKILNSPSSTGNEDGIDLLLVNEYDELFHSLLGLHPELVMDHPDCIEIIRIALLQKILTFSKEVESELQEYVLTLNRQKAEMASHYLSKLLEASKKKASREFFLQEELKTKTNDRLDHKKRSFWDTIPYFRHLCLQCIEMQQYLLQTMADANEPLNILPESLSGSKRSLLDSLVGIIVPHHSGESRRPDLQHENDLLYQQALILDQELSSLQQKARNNENRFSWVR